MATWFLVVSLATGSVEIATYKRADVCERRAAVVVSTGQPARCVLR